VVHFSEARFRHLLRITILLFLVLDIDNQGSAQQEVYFYMNSNHEQTETYRTGFFGP
jgi:hypothetical protein